MISATNPSRHRNFSCLLGLCVVGALNGCALEIAPGEDGITGEGSEALTDPNWTDLGKPATGVDVADLAVSKSSGADPVIWVAGSDGKVWNRTPSSGWNSIGKPSGVTLNHVSACRRGLYMELAATDTTRTIWSRTTNAVGVWQAWTVTGATPAEAVGAPTVTCVTASDRVDVWARGPNDTFIHAYRFGSQAWSGWIDEGAPSGGLKGPPAAFIRNAVPLTIDIVSVDSSANIVHRAWLDGWYDWEGVGGMRSSTWPAMGIDSAGHPLVIAKDVTGKFLNYGLYNGGWQTGYLFDLPTSYLLGTIAFVAGSNGPDVYVRGKEFNVWRHK